MALARWAPFEMASRPDRDFDDLVRRFFGELGSSAVGARAGAWAPRLDAFTKDGELHVQLEAPGIDPEEDVDIEVKDGVLTIQGERRQEDTSEGEGYFRREMNYGRFERSIALPQDVDPSQIQATYDAGILDIAVPLPEERSQKVRVEVGPGTKKKELK